MAREICREIAPVLRLIEESRKAECHFAEPAAAVDLRDQI
jgi:hypothetical protein